MSLLTVSQQTANKNHDACISAMPRRLVFRQQMLLKKVKRSHGDLIRMLRKLYACMDEINSWIAKYTPCRKGCSNCCYIPVSITEIDVLFIEKSLPVKRQFAKLAVLPESACPFLVSNSCSIYAFRPFVCRKNVTFDASSIWCHVRNGAHAPMPALQYGIIDLAYLHLASAFGATKVFDIREFFGIRELT